MCILGHLCEYEYLQASSTGSSATLFSTPETHPGSVTLTSGQLKDAIIQALEPLSPANILSSYHKGLEAWFPIISGPDLQRRLSSRWDSAPLDAALLSLSILLVTTAPPASEEVEKSTSNFKLLYLEIKSFISMAEGLGVNSFPLVQTRTLVTLFEVTHGFYPAAYISIGATLRAAEASESQIGGQKSPFQPLKDNPQRAEQTLTWYGITILDR